MMSLTVKRLKLFKNYENQLKQSLKLIEITMKMMSNHIVGRQVEPIDHTVILTCEALLSKLIIGISL